MGQAKNRKSEIQALKARGSKQINPFIIRGSIVAGRVVYDTSKLAPEQAEFVAGCVKSINEDMLAKEQLIPEESTHLTFVYWISKDDFIGSLMGPFKEGTPDSVYADAEQRFNKHQSQYPQVGFTYTRDEMVELGTEQAAAMMDMMSEDAVWYWPNARATFQKQGDRLVVIETV